MASPPTRRRGSRLAVLAETTESEEGERVFRNIVCSTAVMDLSDTTIVEGLQDHFPARGLRGERRQLKVNRMGCGVHHVQKSISDKRRAEFIEPGHGLALQADPKTLDLVGLPLRFGHLTSSRPQPHDVPDRGVSKPAAVKEFALAKYRVVAHQTNGATSAFEKGLACVAVCPVCPADRIVLTVGVVVARCVRLNSSPPLIIGYLRGVSQEGWTDRPDHDQCGLEQRQDHGHQDQRHRSRRTTRRQRHCLRQAVDTPTDGRAEGVGQYARVELY